MTLEGLLAKKSKIYCVKLPAWYDTGRFSLLDRRTTAEWLISRIHSGLIERIERFYANRTH